MKTVKITAIRRTEYPDLMAKYENPITHTCDVQPGQVFSVKTGKDPKGFAKAHGSPWHIS